MDNTVKAFLVLIAGLALVVSTAAVAPALQKLAGGNYCTQGSPAQLPAGKSCEQGYEPTSLNAEGGGCGVWCCKDNADGKTIDCRGQILGARANVGAIRSGTNLPLAQGQPGASTAGTSRVPTAPLAPLAR